MYNCTHSKKVEIDLGDVWDENKYEKVKSKHRISFAEVVSAMEDPKGFEEPDESSYEEDQWIWVGKAFSGRVLVVVYNEEDLPLHRLITSFEAEGRWLDEYEQQ